MAQQPASAKPCGECSQAEGYARAVWERTCTQFELAGAGFFRRLPFHRALVSVERNALRKSRVPLRADYRDRMLTALVRAKLAFIEHLPDFVDVECTDFNFEAVSALIVFWSEGSDVTENRPISYVSGTQSGTAAFKDALRALQRQERAEAQLLREYKQRTRQSRPPKEQRDNAVHH